MTPEETQQAVTLLQRLKGVNFTLTRNDREHPQFLCKCQIYLNGEQWAYGSGPSVLEALKEALKSSDYWDEMYEVKHPTCSPLPLSGSTDMPIN